MTEKDNCSKPLPLSQKQEEPPSLNLTLPNLHIKVPLPFLKVQSNQETSLGRDINDAPSFRSQISSSKQSSSSQPKINIDFS